MSHAADIKGVKDVHLTGASCLDGRMFWLFQASFFHIYLFSYEVISRCCNSSKQTSATGTDDFPLALTYRAHLLP